jgi:hypothetical protein
MFDSTSRPNNHDDCNSKSSASRPTSCVLATTFIPVALILISILSGCGSSSKSDSNRENRAPKISGAPEQVARAGEEFSFTPDASDPDGDKLAFEITNLPRWASFEEDTGEIWGFPEQADVGEDLGIVISVSDGEEDVELEAFALAVLPQLLNRSNFATTGEIFETEYGYESVGTLTITTGDRTQEFEESDLELEFDEEGHLVDLHGTTIVPANPTDDVTINSAVEADVLMMTGAEINDDDRFKIELNEHGRFLVFFIDASIDMTIPNGDDSSQSDDITLNSPLDSKIILITDPSDPFVYWFGSQAILGEFGRGYSANGLVPFTPMLDSPELDSFSGNEIDHGVIGIGIKIFDFFSIEGTRVIQQPDFAAIDWDEPLQSDIDYKAGLNGDADFSFSVLGVGLFSFDLAETSATFDVGFDRQHLAMQTRIGPDVSWVPGWFPFVPTTETNALWSFDGNGDYLVDLDASFRSENPPADVAGVLTLENGTATLAARTISEGEPLEVSISFSDDVTVGRIKFPDSLTQSIESDIQQSVDRAFVQVEQALADLEDAAANYEFEASLRGLRILIPDIVNPVISMLNALPGSVGSSAYTSALAVMASKCVLGKCIDDLVDEKAYARDVRDRAKSETQTGTNKAVKRLNTLKTLAAQGDDETLRAALKQSLQNVYDNRVFSVRVKVTRAIKVGLINFGTVTMYDKTHTRTLFDTPTATRIRFAAVNVDKIPATSDILIGAQQLLDELPLDEALDAVKQDVADGIAVIPTPEGLGYRAIGDSYEAFVTIGGVDYDMEINVLSPSDVQEGVSDLLRDLLLGGE